MGEEIDESEHSYKDVARACTRWLIKRGIYSKELSFRECLEADARSAMLRKEKKLQAEREKIDSIVDELSSED